MASALRRMGFGIAVVGLGLALGAGSAPAQSAHEAGLSGVGMVMATDAIHHTVTIGSKTYRVTDTTQLRGERGEEIPFGQIPVFREGSDGSEGNVRFEAHEGAAGLELESLRLVQQPR